MQSRYRQKRTQHSHGILQQSSRVLLPDDHYDQSNMNYIIFALEVLGKRCEEVLSVKRYILRQPSLIWKLVCRNIEAVELRRSRQRASILDQPYSVYSCLKVRLSRQSVRRKGKAHVDHTQCHKQHLQFSDHLWSCRHQDGVESRSGISTSSAECID